MRISLRTLRSLIRFSISSISRACGIVSKYWQVGVKHFLAAHVEILLDVSDHLMSAAFGPKAIGAALEPCFKDRFDRYFASHLHYPISYRRDAERPQFAVGFLYPATQYSLRFIRPLTDIPKDCKEP